MTLVGLPSFEAQQALEAVGAVGVVLAQQALVAVDAVAVEEVQLA